MHILFYIYLKKTYEGNLMMCVAVSNIYEVLRVLC